MDKTTLKIWKLFLITLLISFGIFNSLLLAQLLPSIAHQSYVLLPITIVILITIIGRTIYPDSPPFWLKLLLNISVLTLHIRYLSWRLTETLVLDWYNVFISLAVLIMEFTAILNVSIISFQTLSVTNHSAEADRRSQRIQKGDYAPTVDVLIPTYNEPTFVLRRTLVGCQSMHYSHKKVWVLDDRKRPEIAKLAKELGCKYLTRPNLDHAKAGNLNNGLSATDGEIVVLFDADFIPLNNFLERTLSFFEYSQVAMVVTPQNFYNSDPPQLNLGGGILPHEQTVFYNIIQPGRDFSNSIICTGTSILLRRKYLDEVGGIPTSTLVEDWLTGMMLQSRGYKTIFLDELLSVGAAAENLLGYLVQRVRWAEGTVKVIFSKYNPLLIPGFSLVQRINHFSGILYWIDQAAQLISYFAPALFVLLGMQAIRTNLTDVIVYWLPAYIAGLILVPWVVGTRTILVSYVYNVLQCFSINSAIIKLLFFPNKKLKFRVTPKGVIRNKPKVTLKLMRPIGVLFIINLISLIIGVLNSNISNKYPGSYTISMLWMEFNLVILGVSLLAGIGGIYSSEERIAPRVQFSNSCEVMILGTADNKIKFSSEISDISEYGVSFYTPETILLKVGQTLIFSIHKEGIQLKAKIRRVGKITGCRFLISYLNAQEQQRLIEFVYCRPEHWIKPKVANEMQAIKALFITLFELYPLQKKR